MKIATNILLILTLGLTLLSCSATNRLSMTVTRPAQVDLGPEALRIGIVNRSLAADEHKALDQIEKILTAEGQKLDQIGAASAIDGLADALRLSGNYEVVAVLEDTPEISNGLKVLPKPLSGKQVRKLCEEYGLDAIFSLEYYDTDTKSTLSLGKMKVANAAGIKIEVPAHKLELQTLLRNGWRIYRPGYSRPVDEFLYKNSFVSRGEGVNPLDAFYSITNRKNRIIDLSHQTGVFHASRMEPQRVRVGRNYFVRGSDLFVKGKRRAQTGDWNGAAALWEQELSHPKVKVAGRAHYNMAIINEINGNLEEAIGWASKAYTDFNNKEALRYVNILKSRFAEQNQLEAQLSR